MSDWKGIKNSTFPQTIPDKDWMGYKHSFQKIITGQKNIYNEGDIISDSSNPVWETSDIIEPVTAEHQPCGYWHSKEGRRLPRNIEYLSGSQGIDASVVTWMPINGLPLGRFVAYIGFSIDRFHISDDGGYTWYNGSALSINLLYGMQTIYFNDGDVILYGCGRNPIRSYNGIDWELCGVLPYTDTPHSFSYHSLTNTLICASPKGANVSTDKGMTWSITGDISNYSDYQANVYYKEYTYIMAYNYTSGARSYSPLSVGSWKSLTGLLAPWDYVNFSRAEAATNDEIITYSNCYFNGSKWVYHGVPIYRVDYNRQFNFFAATLGSAINTITISEDGITWLPLHTSHPMADVAVGIDRIIGVGFNYYTSVIITL